ncbi:unnamed protein product [Porites lobata]|uniref:G-protein coupled receptors family 1 profile domain-containing protein n=1 Tax=Porites lobata TaxID=104759 RepID=A0ABN8NGM8_9CNID|nr:unnamed protein product [Porites lobata]
MTGAESLYSTVVANCVFNAFLCYTAIALNIITIEALRNTSSIPCTLKTLLLSLAVSDLGVGLLVHPLYIARLVMNTEQGSNISAYHGVYTVHLIIGYVFSNASFLGVVLLTVDRFLAIHLHLRYRQLVTHKRVIVAVILKGLLSSVSSLFNLDRILEKVNETTSAIIYRTVKHHKNRIHALQVQQAAQNAGQMANSARLRKTVVTTFYAYIVFLVCYLPLFCVRAVTATRGESALGLHLLYYAATIMYLNSSLNPLIYCWQMRHIRQAVVHILRSVFPCQ